MVNYVDKFVIASYALWAGDFEYYEEVMKAYLKEARAHASDQGIELPENVIAAVGKLRLRQLRQKRGEFRKLTEEFKYEGIEISDLPLIMHTDHMRAALWRTGERSFSMYAYLTDLSWEKKLFHYAHELAFKHGAEGSEAIRTERYFPRLQKKKVIKGLGVDWFVVGNPFIQIGLSDLGMIEAYALWTEQRLPKDAKKIIKPLSKVLNGLEGIGA